MDNIKMEEKIKRIVLEEIKNSAIEAWSKPTDDNICKMFNNVEYLKKVLKNDNYSNSISVSPGHQSPISRGWYNDNVIGASNLTITNITEK